MIIKHMNRITQNKRSIMKLYELDICIALKKAVKKHNKNIVAQT